ncbi:sensor histidine kinase [Scleromatobacter humisilvae]|uniref:histidine kinase n=1 Tax=Scleromatobacter humisilvae TaxID=2897159 RepID=A0A9X2C3T9_9BURK|nr:histidine kinase [Scleromatobacter humisilvae]MCK9688774.1 histidine kinase [Scleromatobacter humisilvae]
MATPSYNSPTPQERWHRFSAAAVRAFHRYATWLVSLSWWRFGWYALLLIIATGLLQKLPPFSMTYYETIVDTVNHRKARHAMPMPPAMPASVAPLQPLQKPEQPAKAEKPEPAESAAGKSSKTVDIQLPGIIVNTKDHTIKNKGVNITFTGDGIHITNDDDTAAAAAAATAASQAQAALAGASAAKAAGVAAKDRAEAARYEAVAKRDAELAKALAAKAAAEQARAQALGGTAMAQAASSASSSSASASASAAAASETAVDMVVGGQHIHINVPAHATSDEVRDAIEEAKSSILDQLKDAEEARRAADQEAADNAKAALEEAKARKHDSDSDDNEDDNGTDSEGRHTREHTVHYGNLPMLAVWWILGSMLIKITYKGRIQAEVKAAEATETAEAESLRRQVLEARMAMMQAQVEPHFLFNTLASIDHLIEFDPKRASQMQRNLISLLRASMPSMRTATDSGLRPLDLELAVVRPYLEILKVRMEERLTTEIDVPDGLLSAEFPPMMVQTLVENSIKHGLEPKAEGGHLAVKAEIRHGKLCVTVSDTGLGFAGAAEGKTAGTGVGLANIRERLSLLYGNKAALTIANNPVGGTIVTITVPYTAHTEPASDEGAKA